MRQEWRRAAAGVVRAAAAKDACARKGRLVRGDQGPYGEDRRCGAEQMVSDSLVCSRWTGIPQGTVLCLVL